MFYEVTTLAGNISIVQADSSREAKVKVCKDQGFKPSDRWSGISSMHARKLDVDYPETVCYPSFTDESLQSFAGKDVILFDEHHGTAIRIRKSTIEKIRYFLNEYTSIIDLRKDEDRRCGAGQDLAASPAEV